MTISDLYPFFHHPCYASSRDDLWARIHLPVAKKCNVKCVFCDHNSGTSCHTSKPGYASQIMNPDEAIERTLKEFSNNNRLRIVAISGPGEPLANRETYVTLKGLRNLGLEFKFCLSTNGTLLSENMERICELDVSTISVSMSAQDCEVVASLYEWAFIDGKNMQGISMAKEIVERQLNGIQLATEAGISVKVNTILIPEINAGDIFRLSCRISEAGAQLQNIVPLVSCGSLLNLRPPTAAELNFARERSSKNIRQFTYCRQCRSDVVGIPGDDRVL